MYIYIYQSGPNQLSESGRKKYPHHKNIETVDELFVHFFITLVT